MRQWQIRRCRVELMRNSNWLGTHLWMVLFLLTPTSVALGGEEDWVQFKYDARRSGNAPERRTEAPLGLVGAIPMNDAILTSPVVSDGRVYVVDASGVAFCIDAETLEVEWTFKSRGGKLNCNNVSSPAVAGRFFSTLRRRPASIMCSTRGPGHSSRRSPVGNQSSAPLLWPTVECISQPSGHESTPLSAAGRYVGSGTS